MDIGTFSAKLNESKQRERAAQALAVEAVREWEAAARLRTQTRGHRFSIVRFCTALAGDGLRDGIEREYAEESAHRMGRTHDPHRASLDWGMLIRALNISTGSQGAYLIGDPASAAVDSLFPYSTVLRLGAVMFDAGSGDVNIPRINAAASAQWLAELGTHTGSEPTLGVVNCSPKIVGGFVQLSRQLTIQAPATDRLLGSHLLSVVGAAIDAATLVGTGTTQPLGVRNVPGATVTLGTSLSNSALQTMARVVGAANVRDDLLGFLGPSTVKELLGGRASNGTGSRFLWVGTDLAGYRAAVSNNAPSGHLFAGDFSNVQIPLWGGLSIESNPYDNFRSGGIGLRVFASVDVAVVQPSGFSISTGIT